MALLRKSTVLWFIPTFTGSQLLKSNPIIGLGTVAEFQLTIRYWTLIDWQAGGKHFIVSLGGPKGASESSSGAKTVCSGGVFGLLAE